jgi:hypothetical protein
LSRLRFVWLLCLFGATSFADDLHWLDAGNNVWSIFYVSPYTAKDSTIGKQLSLFCMDYNHDIAPPMDWQANLTPLVAPGPNPGANLPAYQFGGSYPNVLPPYTTAANAYAFQSETYTHNSATVTADLSTSAAYDRYLETAWLFTQIEDAIQKASAPSPLINQQQLMSIEQVYQVAAWRIFADTGKSLYSNYSHLDDLNARITQTGGRYVFNVALGVWVRNDSASSGYNDFQFAVDSALANAADQVKHHAWLPAYEWSVVTADKNWVAANDNGVPLQEFLTPYAPNPEPAAILLLLTVVVIVIGASHRHRKRVG